MRAPRIAVSGVGLVSALGQTADATFRELLAGTRGIAPITLFDPGDVKSKLVAEARGVSVAEAGQSRTDIMAVTAAKEAARDAKLPPGARLGVVLGGTTGGMFETEALLSRPELLADLPATRAAELVSYPLSASLSRVASVFGGAARTRSICSACSGGAVALVQGAAWLARGEVDFVLAGGADALCRLTLLGFNALGATDAALCRPFDRARAGLNLGEGAAVLVLEREETAVRRGATPLAWLDGFAVGAEAHHITHPEPSGARAVRLLRETLSRAGLAPSDVAYVNAHGTGTQQNDAMEARALLEVLGANAGAYVSSSKAQLGHTLGAAGAIEAALTVLAVARGQVPPTAGLADPEAPELRHVLGRGITAPVAAALSSSFGFGGMSCVLGFSHVDRAAPPATEMPSRVYVAAAAALDAQSEPERSLDAERSRRFDVGSALAAAGAAQVTRELASPSDVGFVLGTAFGNVERTMAFLARGRERGARLVPPAEFPHLVPSAPVGNASVYADLGGPVFAVSELSQSGEAAIEAACDLLELGSAARIVAGAIAPRDAIVERVLSPLYDVPGAGVRRGAGAGFALLASGTAPPGTTEMVGRYVGTVAQVFAQIPQKQPQQQASVVLAITDVATQGALRGSSWGGATLVDLVETEGRHEALGSVALATACQRLAAGDELVLVLSGASGHARAFLLGRAS